MEGLRETRASQTQTNRKPQITDFSRPETRSIPSPFSGLSEHPITNVHQNDKSGPSEKVPFTPEMHKYGHLAKIMHLCILETTVVYKGKTLKAVFWNN